ncbi:hypothetical protein CTAM01_13042 [Colletotrichum tamarilloi]|uniref:Uncharacterized protein n=1 Tax=Colletotrichum tamarilloi TaxID=1209934 RepID=A0ABQ9QT64_9PEZI|nr:uncharacterized protein CTAM01_13042 [Colletotrichum tamarilloi]KAK1484129.1 hypothetical protein CTAM01_13042 [Colletotrichum tamarilloi]
MVFIPPASVAEPHAPEIPINMGCPTPSSLRHPSALFTPLSDTIFRTGTTANLMVSTVMMVLICYIVKYGLSCCAEESCCQVRQRGSLCQLSSGLRGLFTQTA